jgi:hypothetical protein
MQITDEVTADGKAKMLILNWPKPRQQSDSKHSMNIDGRKDFQIDEAYLLLGKARYYDQGLFR